MRSQAIAELIPTLFGVLEGGRLGPSLFAHLRIHLDWIQYRANFREPVTIRRAVNRVGERLPLAELAVDLRQAEPARWAGELGEALARLASEDGDDDGRVVLDDFAPLGDSAIWRFN